MRALFLLFLAASALAAPKAYERRERAALRKVAAELGGLAKFCAGQKAYGEARDALRTALLLDPAADRARKDLAKFDGKTGEPKPGFAEAFGARRKESHAKCARELLALALWAAKEEHDGGFEACVTRIRMHFPEGADLAEHDLVWFAPYLRFVRREDHARLEAGGERVDGRWLGADEVKGLDAQRSWSDPWVLADEVHEVRTAMGLRTARAVMAHVQAFRAYFLAQFSDLWDLRPPKGLLPVIVCDTQEEMQAQARKLSRTGNAGDVSGIAYYLWSNVPLNPCFVTFEPVVEGKKRRIELEGLVVTLRHEVAHQLAYEYVAYGASTSRPPSEHFWVIEGLASFLESHVIDERGWRITHPTKVKDGDSYHEGRFSWCKQNVDRLPPLQQFLALPKHAFPTVDNYNIAATLTYFLLHGEGGRYRAPFLEVAHALHQIRGRPDTFTDAFRKVKVEELEEQWRQFIRELPIEDD